MKNSGISYGSTELMANQYFANALHIRPLKMLVKLREDSMNFANVPM